MSVQEPARQMDKQCSLSIVECLCQCQICYMKYNETTKLAQMLHCGHTFCRDCIGNIQKYGNSAYLECPTCRAETKCDVSDIATNFLVMEIFQKFQMMGPAEVAPVKEPKLARNVQRERTIDEMVDEKYRQLIADVKAELMSKFEELRESLRKSTIHTVQSELESLSDTVMDAVRDAYDGMSESELETEEEDEENDDDRSISSLSTATWPSSDHNEVSDSNERPRRYSFISRHMRFIRTMFRRRTTLVVANPMESVESTSNHSSDSSEEGSACESDDDDSNDGCSEMSEMTSEGE